MFPSVGLLALRLPTKAQRNVLSHGKRTPARNETQMLRTKRAKERAASNARARRHRVVFIYQCGTSFHPYSDVPPSQHHPTHALPSITAHAAHCPSSLVPHRFQLDTARRLPVIIRP